MKNELDLSTKLSSNDLLEKLATKLQDDCHKSVSYSLKNSKKKISYQDCTNAWVFTELAKIIISINTLESKINTYSHE